MNNTNLDKTKDEVLVANNAQTIFDHINELEKDRLNNGKRWFWELLQNAKDAVNHNEFVSINVQLENDNLIFSHTGNPFREQDIIHLIFHGSSKVDEENKTGRFGTGFMTTHLLSKKVIIKGFLTDGRSFNFLLDRQADKHSEMKELLDDSYQSLKNSLEQPIEFNDEFKTVFEYQIDRASNPYGNTIAEEGLRILQDILPVVLALNFKLKSITTRNQTFKKEEAIDEIISSIQTIIVETDISIQKIITLTDDNFSISVILEKDRTQEIWHVKDLTNDYPRLFFDFPLFGTEKLGIPFIINSTKYEPRRERDGVYLQEINDDKIKPNVDIIEKAFGVYIQLVKYVLSLDNIESISNLFLFQHSLDYNWLNLSWFKKIQNDLISTLEKEPGLYLDNGKYSTLLNVIIPFSERKEEEIQLFDITKMLYPENIISLNHLSSWLHIAEQYAIIREQNITDFVFIYTKQKLCKTINEFDTIESFSLNFFGGNKTLALNWISSFLNILSAEELIKYSASYKIIPNQAGFFLAKSANIPYIEENIDDHLKSTAELYGWKLRNELIDTAIVLKTKIFEFLSQDKVLNILGNFNNQITTNNLDESKRKAIISHFSWLLKAKDYDRLKKLMIYLEDGNSNLIIRQVFTDDSKKLIIPSKYWIDNYSIYIDLVSKRHVLLNDYAENLNLNEYEEASELFILQPLIEKKISNRKELKDLVKNHNPSYTLDHIDIQDLNMTYSEIAYLTTSDDGILNKTGQSINATQKLLEFIFTQILPIDSKFKRITNYKDLMISECLWLERLKDVQWVAFKYQKDDSDLPSTAIKEERATTSSLSQIISEDKKLVDGLKSELVASFFNSLNISIADIIRLSIADENEKLKWDLIFSRLITSNNINPDLAQTMLEDPDLQKIYENKEKTKGQIKRNQEIGYLFEKKFKELLNSEKYKELGLEIERVPRGSDFEISLARHEELEDIVENGQVINWRIGNIFLELKATSKEYAEMTEVQAEKARDFSKNYALVVLPLAGYPIDEYNIWARTKFIVSIGDIIENKYNSYLEYKGKRLDITKEDEQAKIFIEEGKTRFQIKSKMWSTENSFTFEQFLEWLKK